MSRENWKNPYEKADKAAQILRRRAIRRFQKTKEKSAQLHFDELNVLKITKDLYKKLDADNRQIFLELAQEQYKETAPDSNKKISAGWLALLLASLDPVTKYRYENEVTRKQEYLEESVLASSAKATQFRRALNYWCNMTAHYADSVRDEAVLQAYKDSGVKKVQWVAEMDGRECETCRDRNGKVYPIGDIPAKTHWGCRCTLRPVVEVDL